jgi:hypothetical protein
MITGAVMNLGRPLRSILDGRGKDIASSEHPRVSATHDSVRGLVQD